MINLGNTNNIIDWQSVVDLLKTTEPGYVGPRHSKEDDIIGIIEMDRLWTNAGHKLISENGTAGWDMFFPGVHFSNDIVDKFSDFIGCDVINCWISRIHPGNMTPWHWDCNDDEENYSKMNNMVRVHCHISKPQHGHAIMVEDECLYYREQGEVYQWPARTSWHGGINCGITPKYLFNYFGTKR